MKIKDLQPGMMFEYDGSYALKSEYVNDKGICECIIVGSGEMFWGGVDNPNDLEVTPIDFEYKLETIERLKDYIKYTNKELERTIKGSQWLLEE